jgi:hypothetical protein
MLADPGNEHTFVTDEGREAFAQAVVSACEAAKVTRTAPVEWYEEWELIRSDDGEESSVQIISATEARDVGQMVESAVYSMLEKAIIKFAGERWAALHVVVFDRQQFFMTAERVRGAMSEIDSDEIAALDFVLLADGDSVEQVWPSARVSTQT